MPAKRPTAERLAAIRRGRGSRSIDIRDLLAEIDALTAERDAANAANVKLLADVRSALGQAIRAVDGPSIGEAAAIDRQIARREGAEAMREAAVRVADDFGADGAWHRERRNASMSIAHRIRALPLPDAPSADVTTDSQGEQK